MSIRCQAGCTAFDPLLSYLNSSAVTGLLPTSRLATTSHLPNSWSTALSLLPLGSMTSSLSYIFSPLLVTGDGLGFTSDRLQANAFSVEGARLPEERERAFGWDLLFSMQCRVAGIWKSLPVDPG
jgi:hypothetical protein